MLAAYFLEVTTLWREPPLTIFFEATWLCTVLVFVGVGAYLLDQTQRVAWLRQLDLAEAEDQIRVLLHNVLPPSIVARKLGGETVIADNYAEASLLFADVVNFTSLSARVLD